MYDADTPVYIYIVNNNIMSGGGGENIEGGRKGVSKRWRRETPINDQSMEFQD